ncbi:MAG: hypothetical protein E6I36_03050 [Chloroflexi bacterium]|nr:MAG: hypothetical protein E6I36_03050 [Chloroflexota bacterium]
MTKMAATDRRTASPVGRYAWTFFVFVGAVLVLFGLTDLIAAGATFGQGEAPTFDGITGTSWESIKSSPVASQIDWMVRGQAIMMMIAGLLTGFISATAFRRGERWAWVAMALWPIAILALDLNLLLALSHTTQGIPPPLVSGSIFIVLSLFTLALTFRKAFRAE